MIRILSIALLTVLCLTGCEGCFPGHDIGAAAAIELPVINTIYYNDTSGAVVEVGIKYGVPAIEERVLSVYEYNGKIVVIRRDQSPVYYTIENVTYIKKLEK